MDAMLHDDYKWHLLGKVSNEKETQQWMKKSEEAPECRHLKRCWKNHVNVNGDAGGGR